MELSKLMQRYIPILSVHLLFILFFAYLVSPLSKVDTISVEGNQDVYDQKIIDVAGVNRGDSLYKSQKKFTDIDQKILKELPQISQSKSIMKDWNNMVIQIEEFNTVAYIAKDESYLRVLENGQILDDLYTISLGNQLILSKFQEGEALNLMIEELRKLNEPIVNLISEIELVESRNNPLFIRVYMNNGNRVLAKIPDFSEKILYYPQMVQAVEGKKGVFDMEAGVYFIPFIDGESEESGINEEERQSIEGFES